MKKNLIFKLLTCCILIANISVGQVSFTASSTSGCIPLSVTFTNTSTVGNYYHWSFGDGNSKDSVNATHVFTQFGMFNVRLDAYDTTGGGMSFVGSYNFPNSISVNGSVMSITGDTACPGENVGMYIYPNGNNINWDFGDPGSGGNNSANGQQASHVYSAPGTYTITATANTSCGFQTIIKQVVIKPNAMPNPWFFHRDMTCPNEIVDFNPQNYLAASYTWNFGDGSPTSNDDHPQHVYTNTGNYGVTLTIASTCGTTSTHTDTVHVVGNLSFNNQNIQINQSASLACPGDEIEFNCYTNALTKIWHFGNGDSSMVDNPKYAYPVGSSGTYNVTLTLINGCGDDTTISTAVTIGVGLPYSGNAQMMTYPDSVCPGDPLMFFASPAMSYSWNFGDGSPASPQSNPTHMYANVGTYGVMLTLTNGCGSDTIIVDSVHVSGNLMPVLNHNGNNNNWGIPDNTNTACPGDSMLFYAQGVGGYSINFGDGSPASLGSLLTVPSGNNGGTMQVTIFKHAYATVGLKTVTLTATNGCGNTATDTLHVSIGGNSPVNGGILLPDNGEVFNSCQPIHFLSAGGSNYKWLFGNGDSLITNQSAVDYAYSTPGNYTVTLEITNGCGNTATDAKNIVVQSMNISASSATSVSCPNMSDGAVTVMVNGGVGPYMYAIDGGSYQASNVFSGLIAGSHAIVVKDSNLCVNSTNVVIASPAPLVIISSSTNSSCGNSDGSASVSVTGGTGSYVYNWGPVSGTTSMLNNISAGSYSVTVTDSNACTASTTIAVNDSAGPVVTYPTNYSPVCSNSAVITLTGGTPAGGTYSGNGVSAGVFNPMNANAGTNIILYTYTSGGCTSSASQNIDVNAAPIVTYPTTYPMVCVNDAPVLLSGGFPGGGTYSGPGIASGAFDPSVAGVGTHTITYTYTDGNSCSDTATSTIVVSLCTGISSVEQKESIKVYPNPFTSITTVEISNPKQGTVFELYDVLGKRVLLQSLTKEQTFVDRNDLQNGLYFYRIICENKMISNGKLIIE